MKMLKELFGKRRTEEKPQSQEKKENTEGQNMMHAVSPDLNSKPNELFRDDNDLGYC